MRIKKRSKDKEDKRTETWQNKMERKGVMRRERNREERRRKK